MSLNVEIKARVRDLGEMRRRAAAVSDRPEEQIDQEDVFFSVPSGRLKLRLLRPDRGELIFYQRPNDPEPRKSEYFVAETSQPDGLRDVLARAYGMRGVVRKRRLLYRVGPTRIHLDEVEGLGRFVELEVALDGGLDETRGREIASDLMSKLGVDHRDLVAAAYIDLLDESAASR
jgi:predicted adenylyl cyclase CyaB